MLRDCVICVEAGGAPAPGEVKLKRTIVCGVPLVGLTLSADGPPAGAAPDVVVAVVVAGAELVAPAPEVVVVVLELPAQPQTAAHRATVAPATVSQLRLACLIA
jgi:hypothetical protein